MKLDIMRTVLFRENGKSGIMNAGKKVLHGEITCKTFFNKIILQLVRN